MFLDAGAERFERVCLNAGNRGHIVEIGTADLVRLNAATVVDLAAGA